MNAIYIERGRYVRIETRWDIVVIASRMLIGTLLVITGAVVAFAASTLLFSRWWLPAEIISHLFEALLWSVSAEIVLRAIDLFLSRYEKKPIDNSAPPAV